MHISFNNKRDTAEISKPSFLYKGWEIFSKKKKAVLLNGGINLTSVLVIILASRLTQQKLQKLNSTAKVLASSQRTTILHLLAEKYWSKMFTHTLESLSTVIACQFSILGIWMTQRIAATSATRESRELKGLAHALVISPESFLTTTAIQAKVWKMAESILSFTIPCGGGCHFRSLGINKLFSTHIFYICSITLNSKVLIETTGFFIFEWWTCWLQNLQMASMVRASVLFLSFGLFFFLIFIVSLLNQNDNWHAHTQYRLL